MGRTWFACVRVAPEILRDPVALDAFLDGADFFAPEGAVSPRITRMHVSAQDQDAADVYTAIRVFGDEGAAAAQA